MAEEKKPAPPAEKKPEAKKTEAAKKKKGCFSKLAGWMLVICLLIPFCWIVSQINQLAPHYTVQHGDGAWAIARTVDISLDELYRLNPGLKGRIIYSGETLLLPRDSTWREYTLSSGEFYRGFLITQKTVTAELAPVDFTIRGAETVSLESYPAATREAICDLVAELNFGRAENSSQIMNESSATIHIFATGNLLVAMYPK